MTNLPKYNEASGDDGHRRPQRPGLGAGEIVEKLAGDRHDRHREISLFIHREDF